MTNVTVKFFPNAVSFFDVRTIEDVRKLKDSYITVAEFETVTPDSPEDACDRAFEISNHPALGQERYEVFGRVRSMSVGDIAVVDGVEYACLPFGWEAL